MLTQLHVGLLSAEDAGLSHFPYQEMHLILLSLSSTSKPLLLDNRKTPLGENVFVLSAQQIVKGSRTSLELDYFLNM